MVVDADASTRTDVIEQLGAEGIDAASFANPDVAFFFLLGRLDELTGVLVNEDDGSRVPGLLRRLEMLPVPIAVATYSGRDAQRPVTMGVVGGATDPARGRPRWRTREG
jgi:hypothetical protein